MRQHPAVGLLDALLRRGLLEPRQEIFIEQAAGLGFAGELLQGDQILALARDLRLEIGLALHQRVELRLAAVLVGPGPHQQLLPARLEGLGDRRLADPRQQALQLQILGGRDLGFGGRRGLEPVEPRARRGQRVARRGDPVAQILQLLLQRRQGFGIDQVGAGVELLHPGLGSLQLLLQLAHPLGQPGGGLLGGVELGLQLVEDVEIDQRIGDPGRLRRVLGLDRHLEHQAERHVAHGEHCQERIDGRVAGGGGQHVGIGFDLLGGRADEALEALLERTDQGGRQQIGVEFRIPGQVEPVHHLAEQAAAAQHFDLGVDLGGIARKPANHALQIDHLLLLGVEHHHRGRAVARHRDRKGEVAARRQRQKGDQRDEPLAAPERAEKRAKVDDIVFLLGGLGGRRLRRIVQEAKRALGHLRGSVCHSSLLGRSGSRELIPDWAMMPILKFDAIRATAIPATSWRRRRIVT